MWVCNDLKRQGADGGVSSDYEQQRKDLLRKYGVDLEDGAVPEPPVGVRAGARGTRRMDRREVEKIMGEVEEGGKGGVFTWRERNRKKVSVRECGHLGD